MSYAERFEEMCPNLTRQQCEILAHRRHSGSLVFYAGAALGVTGGIVDAVASVGSFSPDGLVVGTALTVVGLAIAVIGVARLLSSHFTLRGAMAASHPEDLFTGSTIWEMYARGEATARRRTPPPGPTPGPIRYCPYCGVENSPDYALCRKCGRTFPSPT